MTRSEVWSSLNNVERAWCRQNPIAYRAFCKEMLECQYGISPLQQALAWFILGWEHHHDFIKGVFK